MSLKEINQLDAFKRLARKEITQKEAAIKLKITERQIRNKYKRYKKDGAKGIIHKSRGKPSPKKLPNEFLDSMFYLYDSKYDEFGPTLFTEMLKTYHNINVSVETVRKYMMETGRWKKMRKKKPYRKRREPRKNIGMLVQIDGSTHNWFENRGPKCTILLGIDDATSEILFLEFCKVESTQNYMTAFKNYILKHGRPISIYVDCHSIFRVNINNQEQDKLTQFGRAMQQLDIEVIYAFSPQAKGRVERANRTLQDVLVKFLRVKNISDIASANIFVNEEFIPYYNNKYSKRTNNQADLHRPFFGYDLESIFSIQEYRILGNDYTIMYNKKILQLTKHQRTILRPKDEILVQENLNGEVALRIRNIPLQFKEIGTRRIGKTSPVEFVNLAREKETSISLPLLKNKEPFLNKEI